MGMLYGKKERLPKMSNACRALIVMAISMSLTAQSAPKRAAIASRFPWEWTDDERIAARTNPDLTASRVQWFIASHGSRKGNTSANPTPLRIPLSVVDGDKTPELFLSTEL